MKHEWKKHEKNIYLPGLRPVLVTVPQQNFFMISGKGNLMMKSSLKKWLFCIQWLMPSE